MAEGEGQVAAAAAGAAPEGGQGARVQPQRSWLDIARSIIFQMVIFYFISSYFRGSKTPPPETKGPDGEPLPLTGINLFSKGQELELFVYLTVNEDFNYLEDKDHLLWNEELVYGNWEDGPNGDGTRQKTLNILVPESVQQNGSWYVHVFMAKSGATLDSESKQYKEQAITYQYKLFNKYRKRRVHNTANLLTGKAEVAPGTLKVGQGVTDAVPDIISYYHPNLTVNLVEDYTQWTRGSVPQPVDKFIEFDPDSGGYYPVLYLNSYWNLAQEYIPLNDSTKNISLTFSYMPLTLFKFNMYAAMGRDNPWTNMMGASEPDDDDQDTIKTTLLETNPYLLGLTIAVSILHSIFEFLAFKNDVQFWRSRKTLEGLSVRSVFFNVFQSLIVLLYILDNETNYVIIISVFIGLCIELWKVTKVVEIKIDRENLIGGIIPRISFVDRPSYKSSTKEYDMLAFKYLGWVLFPLLICYAIYSVTYLEHKGWYSFILSMGYGFLLTFGFITMTPQLFINYKLKSVAHLPWRMLTYKALNTFIDDMFAFVIKMPTMYRIGCFRDDIVFFIYLYQRWIYRVDPKRVNEFGTSGEDHNVPLQSQDGGVVTPEGRQGSEITNNADTAKSVEEKKND